MSIAQKSSKRINNGTSRMIVSVPSILASRPFAVPALPTRTITLASAARRRHSAFTPAIDPTIVCVLGLSPYVTHNSRERAQLCVIVATASIHFLAFYKDSEATDNTTANLAPLLLTYSSLLFSLFGALSTALRAIPVIGIALQDQPFAFVECPTYTSPIVISRAQIDLGDSHTVRRPSIPPWPWLSKGLWDCCTSRLCTSVRPISYPIPFPADSVTIYLRKRGMPHSPGLAVYMHARTVVCPSRWRHRRSCSLRCGIKSPTDFSHTMNGLIFLTIFNIRCSLLTLLSYKRVVAY